MKLRKFQNDASDSVFAEFEKANSTLVVLPTGCHSPDSLIMDYFGNLVPAKEFMVGMPLMGPDSKPRFILKVHRGTGQMYKICPVKGEPFIVNEDHVLTLVRTREGHSANENRDGEIVDVSVKEWMTWTKWKKHIYKLFRVGINFNQQQDDFAIDPYVMGALLGDGSFAATLSFTTKDRQLLDAVRKELSEKLRIAMKDSNIDCGKATCWIFQAARRYQREVSALRTILGPLNKTKSGTKFIPEVYKTASYENRLSMLAGLIDTDGSLTQGGYDIIFKSKILADDTAFIARSCGLAAYVKPCVKASQKGTKGTYYRISVSGDCSVIPCRLPDKVASIRKQKKSVLRTGFSVESLGEGEYVGFTVGPENHYVMGDFTVTHNCGKTVVFADVSRRMHEKTGGRRVMVIAHREELIFQAKDKMMAVAGLEAQVEMGEYRVEKGLFGYPPVIVSTVQTHTAGGDGGGRMGKFDPMEFGLLIIDECFPAGTPVDGKPIETICEGDMVNAFDHGTNAIVLSLVTRTFKSRPSALCRVVFADGTWTVCTPGHPFYNVTTAEYVPASMLTGSDYVLKTKKEKHNEIQKNMQGVRNTFHSILQPVDVLDRVHEDIKDKYATTPCDYELSYLRQGGLVRGEERKEHGQEGACLLLKRVHEDILLDNQFRHHGTDQQDVCLKADDGAESDAQGSDQGEGVLYVEGNGLEADDPVRQRNDHGTPVTAGLRTRLGDGDTHKDGNGAQQRISVMLQGGHREHGIKDRRGSGRQLPSCYIPQAGRREEGCPARLIRVERVEILERGSDGGFGEVCPDGYVYNIEVEKYHNYFADGILVHNCHHSTAETYKRVIAWYMRNPEMKLLGVTATPDRTDEEALGQVFGSVAFDYEVMDAIKDGWLVPVSQQMVTVGHLDLSEVRTTAGDLNAGDISAIMDDEQTLHEIASPTIEICGSRRTLVFAATVKQAERLCEIFNRHREGCASFVCGKTDKDERKLILGDFKAGKTQFVVNVGVLTEGFDDDGVEVVVMARPTKSRALYAQMAGRGTRPHSSIAHALGDMESAADRVAAIKASPKPGCLIIDFAGNCGRHKLCTTADILGGKYSEEEVEKASQKAKNSSVPVDMTEALDEARRESEEAKRREAAKRASIICKAKFSSTSVDPFDVFQIHKTPERGWDKHKTLSDAQLEKLKQQGISTDGLSYSECKQLLDEVFRRFRNNECSFKQTKILKKYGYSGPIKRDQAKVLIDRIAANGWRAVK